MTEIREVAVVSHNLRQRGAAEAGEVKFAVEQRMETAVMLLQEVRNWHGRPRSVDRLRTSHRS